MAGIPPDDEQNELADDSVCPTCGKRLQQRAGSITGWVFGSGACSCLRTTGNEPRFASRNDQRQLQAYALPSLGDNFDVIELVGIGGMGAVYKVADSAGNIFAIKVLRADLAPDPHKRLMFEREIESARRLKHPNLVSIYGFGVTSDQLPFAAMEYVDGKSISQILSTEGFLELERALNLFTQIADGVAYAHSLGIVHLDLKPSNVIVAKNNWTETARVVDFGIARMVTADTEHLTQAEEIVGSLPYMSPEQCRGEPADFRSDIYSMGCLMYEVLTGKSAFQADNPVKTIMRHLSERPRDIRSTLQRLEVPPALIALIEHCIEPEVDARYQLMDELLKDLQSVKTGHSAVVAKQQAHDRHAKAGLRLALWQRGILAATMLLTLPPLAACLSARDTVTQLIVLSNGFAELISIVAWCWVSIKAIGHWKKVRQRMKQASYTVQSDWLMLLSLFCLFVGLMAVLPVLVSSCFVITIASIFWQSEAGRLALMQMRAGMIHPVLIISCGLAATTFLMSIYLRRAASLRKWRSAMSSTSQRSKA